MNRLDAITASGISTNNIPTGIGMFRMRSFDKSELSFTIPERTKTSGWYFYIVILDYRVAL